MEQTTVLANRHPILSIELTNGRQSIKELYFTHGRHSVFSYKPTKVILLATFISIVLSGLLYLLSFSNQVAWIFLFCVSVMVVIICLYLFSVRANKYFRWKKGVDEYLDKLARYEKQYLILFLYSFELVNSDETVIEKWTNIRKASILPTHITLTSETGERYLFPAKAMAASQYEWLTEFVRQKMKDSPTVDQGVGIDNK